MNNESTFAFFSFLIFIFSIMALSISPIINNISNDFSKWGKHNCKFFSDKLKDIPNLDDIQKFKKLKNLCHRQKAVYNLEYISFILNTIIGFISIHLSLLLYFQKENSIKKIIGLFELISGIICFIFTFIYICFNSYILNNDIAYKTLEYSDNGIITGINDKRIVKLFSNGAIQKREGNSYISAYENENDDEAIYILYKDLGNKEYNYDKKYYENYKSGEVCTNLGGNYYYNNGQMIYCEYIYDYPKKEFLNKKLYDSWIYTLAFGCIIFSCNLEISLLGLEFFKNKQ